MPQLLRLRALTAEEEREVGRLVRSRTAPVRVVERARIVDLAAHGWRAPGIAAELGVSQRTVRRWVKRFAAQGLACMKELGMDPAKVNVYGGAIALGHALGSSGSRLLATLVHGLHRRNGRYGLATMCIGVGQGIALIVERV